MEKQTLHMLSVEEKGGQTRRGTQYLAAMAGNKKKVCDVSIITSKISTRKKMRQKAIALKI